MRFVSLSYTNVYNTGDVVRGAEELNVGLDEHVQFMVQSMKSIAVQVDSQPG